MRTVENCNGTKTHYFENGEFPTQDKIMELVGGQGLVDIVTIKTSRKVPRNSVLYVNDMGHVIGPPEFVINTEATEVYHSTCIPKCDAFIVGDAVVVVPDPNNLQGKDHD